MITREVFTADEIDRVAELIKQWLLGDKRSVFIAFGAGDAPKDFYQPYLAGRVNGDLQIIRKETLGYLPSNIYLS